jgi:muramoyltetrapeptide carboxypeptidase
VTVVTLLKPRALETGDRVALVAPASPFLREEFDAGVAELRRLGFEPVFDRSVFDRRLYLAGTADDRARALRAAWNDPGVKGIMTVRGGYGSVQVLPYLSVAELRQRPLVMVGYSDITAVLAYLTTRCGIVAFHGPTVAGRFGRGEAGYDRFSFLRAVMDREPLGELQADGIEAFVDGDAAGPIHGGNLTQLAASLGTPFAFDPPNGCVLFLEDINERPYRLDRLFTQLRLSGIVAKASAIVFGEMPGCDEPDGSVTAGQVLAALTEGFPGPVLFGLPSGHTAGALLTLPLGVQARVVGGPAPRVVIEEAAVC